MSPEEHQETLNHLRYERARLICEVKEHQDAAQAKLSQVRAIDTMLEELLQETVTIT